MPLASPVKVIQQAVVWKTLAEPVAHGVNGRCICWPIAGECSAGLLPFGNISAQVTWTEFRAAADFPAKVVNFPNGPMCSFVRTRTHLTYRNLVPIPVSRQRFVCESPTQKAPAALGSRGFIQQCEISFANQNPLSRASASITEASMARLLSSTSPASGLTRTSTPSPPLNWSIELPPLSESSPSSP